MDSFHPDQAWPGPAQGPCHRVQPWTEDSRARPLIVFFGAKDLAAGQFNFPQTSRDLPANTLLLNNGGNGWYQEGIPGFANSYQEARDLIAAWAATLGASEICFAGTSMGAYGALRYGADMGGRVLAFAADARIGERGTRSARHYDGAMPPAAPDLTAVIANADKRFSADLVVGERDILDLYAGRVLRATKRVRVTSIAGIDHFVPTRLSHRGRLGRLLQCFAAGTDLPSMGAQGRALDQPAYLTHGRQAEVALQARDYAAAEKHARLAHEAYPDGEAGMILLGASLTHLKRYAEALPLLSLAAVTMPEDLETLFLLASCLRHTGHLDHAAAIHDQILRADPTYFKSHYAMALIHQKRRDLERARLSIREALKGHPRSKAYRERQAIIEAALTKAG